MSQKIRSCVNNTNLETIHCESYAARLNPRHDAKRLTPRVILKSKDPPAKGLNTHTNRQNLSRQSSHLKADSLVRKELYGDNAATVEVTVKTHNRERSRSVSQARIAKNNKEPWGKILQASNENVSSFTNFDPLRTIHFLAKEIQCKLQNTLPNDISVQQMISEMQQALSRVPPDVPSSVINLNTGGSDYINNDKCDMKPTKLDVEKNSTRDISANTIQIIKPYTTDGETQTPQNVFAEPERLKQHLAESSEKIEKACEQMETLCSKLKSEKDELEKLLKSEKDTTKLLHRQIDEFKLKQNTSSVLIQSLQSRNNELEVEVKRLRSDRQLPPATNELKALIDTIQKQKFDADEECMALKQQLTVAGMEIEKYETILQARDSQIKEIRNEMSELQEVVNEQLMELQNNPYSSDGSSYTNTTASSTWRDNKPDGHINNTLATINSTAVKTSTPKINNKQYQSLPDDTTTDDERSNSTQLPEKLTKPKKRNERNSKPYYMPQSVPFNMKDKFAEIKKQAMQCKTSKLNN